MRIYQLFLTSNNCYKANRRIKPGNIMVHSTGANNPNLCRYVGPDDGRLGRNQHNNHWNQPTPDGAQKCVHAFIGKLADGSIATYQTLPWDMRGWHSGSGKNGSANDTHISFEICEDGLADPAYFAAAYKEAVELCADLCNVYGIRPERPHLICHSEGAALGIASAHGDVMHWFPKHGKSMDTFRADVAKQMNAGGQPMPPTQPTPEEATIDSAVAAGIISEPAHWLGVITGGAKAVPGNVGYLLEKSHKKLTSKTMFEELVDNALADGIITDRAYWLGVLEGRVSPAPENIKKLIDNTCVRIAKKK